MKIAVIDNYDSFVFNIIHYLEDIQDDVQIIVMKNDEIEWKELAKVDRILLSPGPGIPSEAGELLKVIATYFDKKPILGICLGHQAIGEYFGCQLKNLNEPLHGHSSDLLISDDAIWNNLPDIIQIGHYHSWVIDPNFMHNDIKIIGTDNYENIMAIKHKDYKIYGIQFHPESVLTPNGKDILKNWLKQ